MKILNEEHFQNVKRYAESIGDTTLQKCLERLKSWEKNPNRPCEIELYYDFAPYSFGFRERYPDGRIGIEGGLLYHGRPDQSFATLPDLTYEILRRFSAYYSINERLMSDYTKLYYRVA